MSASAALPRTADPLDAVGARLADRINPIVVKELRQHLRTRTFWVFFSLLLLACLTISLVAFGLAEESEGAGSVTFFAFYSALSVVQHFVIPYTAYRSMAREQEDETWVLLTLTGLGPRRILAGKWSSFVLQGTLYGSAVAPFLLFSYYLNGISLPTIALALVAGFSLHVFLVSVAVSVATLAETRMIRNLLHFVMLGFLATAAIGGTSITIALAEEMQRVSGKRLFEVVAGAVIFGMVTTSWLLFESAASRLSMPTESYAKGPRLLFALQAWGGVTAFLLAWLIDGDLEILVAGSIVFSMYVGFVGLFIASDRDSMAKNHWAKHSRLSLLAPGGLRGFLTVLAVLLVGAGVLGLGWLRLPSGTFHRWEYFNVILGAPAYLVFYLSASILLARMIPHPPWQTPVMVRLVAVGLLTLGSGVPPLVGSLVSKANDEALNVMNPVVGLVNMAGDAANGLLQLVVVVVLAALTALVALTSLFRRDVRWT